MMKILRNDETDFVIENSTSADLSASLGWSIESLTYTYNAGKQLIKTQNFSFKINYKYSPFGKITHTTGDIASRFTFRFSSEHFDTETGFMYYNFHYYSPEFGRWLSQDPIGKILVEQIFIFLPVIMESYVWSNCVCTKISLKHTIKCTHELNRLIPLRTVVSTFAVVYAPDAIAMRCTGNFKRNYSFPKIEISSPLLQ